MKIQEYVQMLFAGKKNIVILELGSNDCQTTVELYNLLTEVGCTFKYYCFEMVPALAEWGKKKMLENDNVQVLNFAVSDKSEKNKTFSHSTNEKYNGSSSLKEPKNVFTHWPDLTFTNSTCDTISVDAFCDMFGIDYVDFIWADLQGSEDLMIAGAVNMLPKIDYLYTEYNKDLYRGALDVTELKQLLPAFDIVKDFGGDVLFKNKLR